MKVPLRYQMTEYDCGPTSLLNAMSFLFEREELLPELVRNIMLYSLDSYGADGCSGKSGTSHAAMMFLSHWLESFGKTGQLDIRSMYLTGREVNWSQHSRLRSALLRGGCAVVRLDLDSWHYVLVTGLDGENVRLFDPYQMPEPFSLDGVQIVQDQYACNRIVPAGMFESEDIHPYAFGPYDTREAVLLFNGKTMLTEENTVEYFI